MANTVRIKRRASGAVGAPSSLANAELAFNEMDDVLYYGKGTGGAGGTATTIEAIGGRGAMVTLSSTQTISGDKTFSGTNDLGASTSAATQIASDNTTKVATTAFVKSQSYLTANQTITISGDASGSGSTSVTLTLTSVGTAGTYTKVTTDAKGRVTAGTTLSAADIPTLTAAKISDFDTQVRTSRLDQMAAPTASVSLNSQKITSLGTPTADTDAATKAYVDAARMGMDVKESVRAATTGANISLSAAPTTLDGISLAANDRILVKDQTTASQNGIYYVATLGTGANGVWTRTTDANTSAEVTAGLFTFVSEGTVNADSGWILTTNDTIVLDTTALAFTQFSGAGQLTAGAGLTKTGSQFDVVTASSARIVVNADSIDLATTGVSASTYKSVTVDTYGRVTGGTNPTTLAGYGISDAQALDATLTALSGVTTAANALIYATAADTFTTTTLSAYGRSLIDDADAATARTTLGLGTISTQASSSVSISGGSITNLTTFDGITIDGGTF